MFYNINATPIIRSVDRFAAAHMASARGILGSR